MEAILGNSSKRTKKEEKTKPTCWAKRLGAYKTDRVKFSKRRLRAAMDTNQTQSGVILTNQPISPYGNHYFEVKLVSVGKNVTIGLSGFDIEEENQQQEFNFKYIIAYRGDNGNLMRKASSTGSQWGQDYGPTYTKNDIIGCGVNFDDSLCFFTKNGKHLGVASFQIDFKQQFYPAVVMSSGAVIEGNFGENPFLYERDNATRKAIPIGDMTFTRQWMHCVNLMDENNDSMLYNHLSDVILVSKEGTETPCHKLILSLRSNVFRAMFEHENELQQRIFIDDFDVDAIRKMIKFIYSGILDDNQLDVDIDLLAIAVKYGLETLKDLCERKLSNELEVDNVLDAWMVAKMVNANILLSSCELFIIEHYEKVMDSKAAMVHRAQDAAKMLDLMTSLFETQREELKGRNEQKHFSSDEESCTSSSSDNDIPS